MHEVSIMTEAVRLAVESASARGATRIHCLCLRVGALSGVVPDALQFAFDAVTAGTMAEGGSLSIDTVPAAWWCGKCAAEFGADGLFAECPRCGAWSNDLRTGRELNIASIEVS